MKRSMLWLGALVLLVGLFAAGKAGAQTGIPDFASYSGNLFVQTDEVNYDICVCKTYEAAYDAKNKAQLQEIMDGYRQWFESSGLLTAGGEHHADFGRFGAYTQEAVWYYFDGRKDLTAFSLNLVDVQASPCHVLLAFKEYEDKFGLDMYYSSEIVLTDNACGQAIVPDFAAYADSVLLGVEASESGTVYRLPVASYKDVVLSYIALLPDYGFSNLAIENMDNGVTYIWLEKHETVAARSLADYGLNGKGCFMLAAAQIEDEIYLTIVLSDGLVMQDTGDRHLVMVPMPVPQPSLARAQLPDFAAYAGDAVVMEGDGIYWAEEQTGLAVLTAYSDLLEQEYGLHSLEQGMVDGMLCMWYTEYDQADQVSEQLLLELDDGMQAEGYLFFLLGAGEGEMLFTIQYSPDMTMVDNGERYQETLGVAENTASAQNAAPAQNTAPAQPTSDRVLVSEPSDASAFSYTYSADTAFMQDMVNYCAGRLSYDEMSDSDNYMVRNYQGDKNDFQLIKDYVNMLVQSNPYLELMDSHLKSYDDSTFYSFAIDYTGKVNLGPQTEQTFTDNMCDIMLYGTIERSRLKLSIWTPAEMELVDLGMRWDGGQVDVSVGGQSALAGLYRNADGTYETTDGRFRVAPGQAIILRDGEVCTTEATFEKDDARDCIWLRYFYRNETLHFSYPEHSLMTGDLFRLSDFQQESSWLVSDQGIFEKENDLVGYRWNGVFLGANHNGDWMTPINAPSSSFTDATVRVMYMDKEIAVFYLYAEYDNAPYTMEGLCAVPLGGSVTKNDVDYVTYVGQLLNVPYEGTEYGASYELFEWEIISGGALATLSGETSKTCTLKAEKPGYVGLRVTYSYGKKEPHILTGNMINASHTKTQDYTIEIK